MISIACFLIGCFAWPRLAILAGHAGRARVAMISVFAAQSIIIFIAAALIHTRVIAAPSTLSMAANANEVDYTELAGIGILAFQGSGQITASRILSLTNCYCDLMRSDQLFKLHNPSRNRRMLMVVLILVGGIIGGLISKNDGGLRIVLWLTASLKACIAISFCLWKRQLDSD